MGGRIGVADGVVDAGAVEAPLQGWVHWGVLLFVLGLLMPVWLCGLCSQLDGVGWCGCGDSLQCLVASMWMAWVLSFGQEGWGWKSGIGSGLVWVQPRVFEARACLATSACYDLY